MIQKKFDTHTLTWASLHRQKWPSKLRDGMRKRVHTLTTAHEKKKAKTDLEIGHVHSVNIRPLFPINLDVDKVLVHHFRDRLTII